MAHIIYTTDFSVSSLTDIEWGTVGLGTTFGIHATNSTGYTGASGGNGFKMQNLDPNSCIFTKAYDCTGYGNIRLLLGEQFTANDPESEDPDTYRIDYSVNGGSTWNTLVSYSNDSFTWRKSTYLISSATNVSQLSFRFYLSDESGLESSIEADDFTIIGETIVPPSPSETFDGFPVKFRSDEESCSTFDERTYCQMVEQNDPLHFAWQLPEIEYELIVFGEFDDECSFSAGGGETGCDETDQYWQTTGGMTWDQETGIICSTAGGTITQDNVVSEAGRYKVTVVIAGYPNNTDNEGTWNVTLGDATSEELSSNAGTYTVYLDVTDISDPSITISSVSSVYCVDSVSVKKMCDDYSIVIKNADGSVVDTFTEDYFSVGEGIFRHNDTMYLKTTWASFGLDDGCYIICVVNNCVGGTPLISNDLSSSTGWTAAGLWSYDSSNDEFDHPAPGGSDFSLQAPQTTPAFTPNTSYIVSYEVKNRSAGSVYISIGFDTIGTSRSADGTYTEILTLGNSIGDGRIYFSPSNDFVGSIDNVVVYLAESVCSQCYDLAETHDCTKLLSWTNDDDAFGIPYSGMAGLAYSNDYTNYLRVKALLQTPRYPQESERFVYSNGLRKILYATSEKIWILNIDYVPQYIHDSIALAKIHDHFYIDGVEYICVDGNYEPEWRGQLKLAQGKLEVQKVIDNNKNKNC